MSQNEFAVLTDEDAIQTITIILAAYSEHFPQLKGKAVRPDLRDDACKAFARQLVERLKLSKTKLCRPVREDDAGKNSTWSGAQR
jgi:hypothetical protein